MLVGEFDSQVAPTSAQTRPARAPKPAQSSPHGRVSLLPSAAGVHSLPVGHGSRSRATHGRSSTSARHEAAAATGTGPKMTRYPHSLPARRCPLGRAGCSEPSRCESDQVARRHSFERGRAGGYPVSKRLPCSWGSLQPNICFDTRSSDGGGGGAMA